MTRKEKIAAMEALHRKFDQRNAGVDESVYQKRVRELAVFVRQWTELNDIPMVLHRGAGHHDGFRHLRDHLLKLAYKDDEALQLVYSGMLDLIMNLLVLAECRMAADVERKTRDASAT